MRDSEVGTLDHEDGDIKSEESPFRAGFIAGITVSPTKHVIRIGMSLCKWRTLKPESVTEIWSSSKSVQCILLVCVRIVMPSCLRTCMPKILHAVETKPDTMHNAIETIRQTYARQKPPCETQDASLPVSVDGFHASALESKTCT